MCDFLGDKNTNFLVRETAKLYPATPLKIILPKLRSMMSDWYRFKIDRYGKTLPELNDLFMHDLILNGTIFGDPNVGGAEICDTAYGCGYQQASEINSSCPPNFLCNVPVYYRERPSVINDGYAWEGAPPSDFELYMRDQMKSEYPDMDAVLMKYAAPTTKYAINRMLHRHNTTGKFRTHGMAIRAPQGGLDGEEIFDSLPVPNRRKLCGRCMDWSTQCNVPYANYVETCDSICEPSITAQTI